MGRIPEAGGMGPTGADALSALNHYMLQENKGEAEAAGRRGRLASQPACTTSLN